MKTYFGHGVVHLVLSTMACFCWSRSVGGTQTPAAGAGGPSGPPPSDHIVEMKPLECMACTPRVT